MTLRNSPQLMAGLIGNMWENDSPVEGIRFCHNLKTTYFVEEICLLNRSLIQD